MCSRVPVLLSSLQSLIVNVLVRNKSKIGIHSNSGLISAIFLEKNDSPQKNINSEVEPKTARNRYAVGEAKNNVISFDAIRHINCICLDIHCILSLHLISFLWNFASLSK